MVMVRQTMDEPVNALTCAGRSPASPPEIALVRRQITAGNPGVISDVRFCSSSMLGTSDVFYWVYFDRNAITSGLFPANVAVELGIVTQEAYDRFVGGPRRSAEELASQRDQLRKDSELADKQADDIQGIQNLWEDLRDSAQDLVQTTGPLVAALIAGYVVILVLKVIDD
jgi:hypothetical protein